MSGAKKKVPVTIMIRTWVEVPEDWTDHDVDFYLNDSSHCLNNELERILAVEEDVCSFTDCAVGHHTADELGLRR